MALTCPRDLFIAGRVIHFIDNKFYNVSVYDVTEAIFTIPTMIDHTVYYSMYKHINARLLSMIRSGRETPSGPTDELATLVENGA